MDPWHDPYSSMHDASDEPSACGYALDAFAAYAGFAAFLVFCAVWLGVGVSGLDSGFWANLLLAILFFFLGSISFVLVVPIALLALTTAWIVGRSVNAAERRELLAMHRANAWRAASDLPAGASPPQRTESDRLLIGLVLGALLGWWLG